MSQACGSLGSINIMQQRPDTMASWLQASERYGPLMPLTDSPAHRPPPDVDDDVNAELNAVLPHQSPALIATRSKTHLRHQLELCDSDWCRSLCLHLVSSLLLQSRKLVVQ